MKLYPMVYPKIPGKPFLFFLDPIQIPPWWILKTHREWYLFKYLPPSDSDPTSVLTGMSMYLCLSFSFKIVVLWAQGWILFCSEAYAFSKCSMFVEWMDEQAVMRNNTFSYYVALKPLLVACRFGGGDADFPLKGSDRCKTDWNTWHCHLALNTQQGSSCLTYSLWPFLEISQFSETPCDPLYMRRQERGISYKI